MLLDNIAGDAHASERDTMSRTIRDEGGAMPPSENLYRLERPHTCGHSSEQPQSLFLDNGPPPARLLLRFARLHDLRIASYAPSMKGFVESVAKELM